MTAADLAPLHVTVDDGVMVLRIDRPEVKNAIDRRVSEGIAAAMEELDQRADVSVAVITGSDEVFSTGMDLKAFLRGERMEVAERGFAGLCTQPPAKPLVAAVEGWALAGGCEIALAADLVVASTTARFGLPEVKRGLTAAAGGLLRLPRKIPANMAMHLALTGEPMTATDAHRFGLVSVLTEPGCALTEALVLARTIAANAPLALAASKAAVLASFDSSLAEAFPQQYVTAEKVAASDDAREGALAFVERRAPRWTAS